MNRPAPNPESLAAEYAARLLASLGVQARPRLVPEHPALGWACSGLMSLTGAADGAPLMCSLPLTACADGALAALSALAPRAALDHLCGARLLAERAAALKLQRSGAISPGGSCRLLQAADGLIALNLARADDWTLLPAWLETESPIGEGADGWNALAASVAHRRVDDLLERGRLLGLAIAIDRPPREQPTPWQTPIVLGHARSGAPKSTPRVIDLSSLWAGPLCGHLLQQLGAEVIKVESLQRPDGARRGPMPFFDLLNAGKRSVALDFASAQGRAQLQALLASADIVIEASRPRALRQLGIDAEALVRAQPGLTWISISGYGRAAPQADWIGYGDDAGVAAGLTRVMFDASGRRVICGDAIADPMTGIHAALAAWSSHLNGGGRLISLALHELISHCLQFDLPADASDLQARQRTWTDYLAMSGVVPQSPRLRAASAPAALLGADNDALLAELDCAC